MRQTMLARAAKSTGDDLGFGRSEHEAAIEIQQRLAGPHFEIAPERIGAEKQGNVGRMLEVGLPDDAGDAVAGTVMVRGRESLKPQNASTPPGEMRRRSAAHPAKAEDDYVVGFHGGLDATLESRATCGCLVTKLPDVPERINGAVEIWADARSVSPKIR